MAILAATRWRSNADLILDCARLGHLKEERRTLDPTYGRGTWWKLWRPLDLTTHDIRLDGVDFRALPHESGEFGQVAFDPPYVSIGGRFTSTLPEFHNQYGMAEAPTSPARLQTYINDGLVEQHRVLEKGGILLVKCQDYVSSGKLWIGTHYTLAFALGLGFEVVDRFEHITWPRPQPKRTRQDGEPVRQHHARRNLSTLFVLKR